MFGIVNSIYVYSKTAVTAGFQAAKAYAVDNALVPNIPIVSIPTITLGFAAMMYSGGSLILPLCLTAVVITPFMFRARQQYITQLGQHKASELSEKDRKEIDQMVKHSQQRKKQEDENMQAFLQVFKPEIKQFLEKDYKIAKPIFFRLTKDEKNFYLLGTYHPVSQTKLPDFVLRKIQLLLQNPRSFVMGEADGLNTAKPTLQQMPSIIFSFTVLLFKICKSLFSFPFFLKGIVRPWYLHKDIDPKISYQVLLERQQLYERGIPFSWFALLTDFMSPGASMFFNLAMNDGGESILPNENGMDMAFILNRKKLGFIYQALEEPFDLVRAQGLEKISLWDVKQVLKIINLVEAYYKECQNSLLECEKTNADKIKNLMYRVMEVYASGDIKKIYEEFCAKTPEIELLSKAKRKLYDNLINFNLIQSGEEQVIARNLNWLPKILHLMSNYREGLIFAGAAHLGGKAGLLNLLAQQGLKVERMVAEEQFISDMADTPFLKETVDLPLEQYQTLLNSSAMLYYFKQKACHQDKKQQDKKQMPNAHNRDKMVIEEVNITDNGKVNFTHLK